MGVEEGTVLICEVCRRPFQPGLIWPGINYCRAVWLLRHIKTNPGLSGWELHQRTGMAYADVVKGLAKGREYLLFSYTKEARESGNGERYRYSAALNADALVVEWTRRGRLR